MLAPTPREIDTDTVADVGPTHSPRRFAGHLYEAVLGALLFCAAIGLLRWNEGRLVEALRGSGQVARDVAEVAPSLVDPAYDGRLVRATGALRTGAPLIDPAMGLSGRDLVHLRRAVEMYQWKQIRQAGGDGSADPTDVGRATYSFAKRWSENSIDSRAFKTALRHANPPMPIHSALWTAQDATLGARAVAPALLESLDAFQPIAPPSRAPSGYTRVADGFYKGRDPQAPEIGDIHVRFFGVPVQPVSVIGEQRGTTLAPFHAANGAAIGVVAPGDQSAASLVAQDSANAKLLIWTMRGVGFVLLALALCLIAPLLSGLASVLPAIDAVIDRRLPVFALGMAAPLTLVTIGLAWIGIRPFVGGALLMAAMLLVFVYRRLRRRPSLMAAVSNAPPGSVRVSLT